MALGEIQRGAALMARLIDDLLDFARFESGAAAPERQRLDLHALLANSLASARARAPDRELVLDLEPLPGLDADPISLRRVVDILLDNALRYAPSGTITLRGHHQDDKIRVEVVDQGPGLRSAERQRVFEPLYRGPNSSIQPLRGAGLGLSLVRQLIERSGGQVGLESRPGHGSTFWFTLPLEHPA
jgi:signal transduction histidine kinase